MTIEQECRDAEDARRERRHRVLAGQSKGDALWKKYKPKCICALRVEDYMVTPNPDCPVHGGLHGKNPYKSRA